MANNKFKTYVMKDGYKCFIMDYLFGRIMEKNFDNDEKASIRVGYKRDVDYIITNLTADWYRGLLCRRFGLQGYAVKSIHEIAEEFNLTDDKVRSIYSKAMLELHHNLEVKYIIKNGLDAYKAHKEKEDQLLISVKSSGIESMKDIIKYLQHVKIWELGLSHRAYLGIARGYTAGLSLRHDNAVLDLILHDDEDILSIRSFGRKLFTEIDEARKGILYRCTEMPREEFVAKYRAMNTEGE